MKSISSFLTVLLMGSFFVLSFGFQATAAEAGGEVKCGDALSAEILQLFKSKDEKVSLGAMLISDYVREDACLVDYVAKSRNGETTVKGKMVKLFYLMKVRPRDGYEKLFIENFPEDQEAFKDLLGFDASLTRTVSGRMVGEFWELSSCEMPKDIREAARAKIERLRNTQLESGWAAELFPESFEECAGQAGS